MATGIAVVCRTLGVLLGGGGVSALARSSALRSTSSSNCGEREGGRGGSAGHSISMWWWRGACRCGAQSAPNLLPSRRERPRTSSADIPRSMSIGPQMRSALSRVGSARTIVDEMVRDAHHRIAIVYQDDAFGQDGLEGAMAALKSHGLDPVVVTTVELGRACPIWPTLRS